MASLVGECMKRRIEVQATCKVCQGFYVNPVILPCGSSFCRPCVEGLSPALCPDCGVGFDSGCLTANQTLGRLVEVAKTLLDQELRLEILSSEASAAEETLFCKQDKVLICGSCYEPESHAGHDVVLADLAAQEYRTYMRKCLLCLKREEKDIMMNKIALEINCESHLRQTTQVWERTRAEFQLMDEFLEKQKRELLAQVTEVYKEIKMDKNKQDLLCTRKLVLVQDVMYEMDEAIQSSEGDLLESIGCILKKFEERGTVQSSDNLSLELQKKLLGLAEMQTFLVASMKHFRGNMTSGFNRHRAGLGILNPVARFPSITSSEEAPSVSSSVQVQPSNPENFSLHSE